MGSRKCDDLDHGLLGHLGCWHLCEMYTYYLLKHSYIPHTLFNKNKLNYFLVAITPGPIPYYTGDLNIAGCLNNICCTISLYRSIFKASYCC